MQRRHNNNNNQTHSTDDVSPLIVVCEGMEFEATKSSIV